MRPMVTCTRRLLDAGVARLPAVAPSAPRSRGGCRRRAAGVGSGDAIALGQRCLVRCRCGGLRTAADSAAAMASSWPEGGPAGAGGRLCSWACGVASGAADPRAAAAATLSIARESLRRGCLPEARTRAPDRAVAATSCAIAIGEAPSTGSTRRRSAERRRAAAAGAEWRLALRQPVPAAPGSVLGHRREDLGRIQRPLAGEERRDPRLARTCAAAGRRVRPGGSRRSLIARPAPGRAAPRGAQRPGCRPRASRSARASDATSCEQAPRPASSFAPEEGDDVEGRAARRGRRRDRP